MLLSQLYPKLSLHLQQFQSSLLFCLGDQAKYRLAISSSKTMPNLLNVIANRQREESRPQQDFTFGIITGYDSGSYKVNANGLTYYAESMVADRLLTGDRVFLVLGKGTPRIIGLQGKDENSL